jgi:hypothetical protein
MRLGMTGIGERRHDRARRAALCYIAPSLTPQPATDDYIDRIVKPAREYGFPDWYVSRLDSFRP